jgi:hypothetical protein
MAITIGSPGGPRDPGKNDRQLRERLRGATPVSGPGSTSGGGGYGGGSGGGSGSAGRYGAFGAIAGKPTDMWGNLLQDAYDTYGQPVNDPYQAQAQQWYNTVMTPGYTAFSPEQISQMYEQGKNQLEADVFQGWEDAYGGTMANRNLTGSGVAGLDMGKILGKEGGALSNLYGDIWQYGQDATRQDVANAVSMYPSLQSMNFQGQNAEWDRLMELLGVVGNERAAKQNADAQNSGNIWGAIGALAGLFL